MSLVNKVLIFLFSISLITTVDQNFELHNTYYDKFINDLDYYHESKEIERITNEIKHSLIDYKQVKCIATNIYFESRGEPLLGQIAVGLVVMNRVKHSKFANTPCKVVYQTHTIIDDDYNKIKVCQFSWYCEDYILPNKNNFQYKQAEKIAKEILMGMYTSLLPQNVLYFHAKYVNPGWKHKKYMTIGNHIFYKG